MPFDMKRWRLENKEHIKEYNQKYMREYYQKHKQELIAKNSKYTSVYRALNPNKYKSFPSSSKEYTNRRYHKLKEHIFEVIGNVCMFCNHSFDVRDLESHHFNHDGHLDRKRFKSVPQMYWYYLKHVDELKNKLKPVCDSCHCKHHWKIRKGLVMT